MKKLLFILILLLIFYGCSKKFNYVENARGCMKANNYTTALKYYKTALDNWDKKLYSNFTKQQIEQEYNDSLQKYDDSLVSKLNETLKNYNPAPSEIINSEYLINQLNNKSIAKDYTDKLTLINKLNSLNESTFVSNINATTDSYLTNLENDIKNFKLTAPSSILKNDFFISRITELENNLNRLKNSVFDSRKAQLELEKHNKKILSSLRNSYDDFTKTKWYYDPSTTEYSNINSVHLYIGKKENSPPWLRFKIQYAADNWLFINSYSFNLDGEIIDFTPTNVERDNNTSIWEWSDTTIDSTNFNLVQKISNSKIAKIRCIGSKYYDDRVISSEEKKAMRSMITAYSLLGGTPLIN